MLRMMKTGWLFALLVSGAAALSARADSTFVAAGLLEGSWTALGSPYVVQGNVTVAAGDSLLVGPGVKVYFAGPYMMTVSGYLAMGGSESDSVTVTTDTLLNPPKWRGFSFVNANDSSFVEYTIFENSWAPGPLGADSLGGALMISGGTTLRVEHSTFRTNRAELAGGAVYVTASTLWMDSCLFDRNSGRAEAGGLFFNNTLNSFVKNTVFFKNESTNGSGGGAYIRGTTPLLTHCIFDSNFARVNGGGLMFKNCLGRLDSSIIRANNGRGHGGGIASENSSPDIFDCLIEHNWTTDFDGGGIYIWESSPHMLRCTVQLNISADDGGGIHSYRATSNGLFEQCTVWGNTAAGEGAGIWVTLDGAPTFVDCVVRRNTAGLYGGGVFLRSNVTPTFTNCEFDSNSSLGNGGGLSIRQSQPVLTHCRVRWNDAASDGGGVHLWEAADAVFDGCEIGHNISDSTGGGVSINQSTLRATNCLIDRNQAVIAGGGVATTNSSNLTMRHCTMAGNLNGGIRLESSIADIENSIIALSTGSCAYFSAAEDSRIAYSVLHGPISFAGGNPAQGPELIGTATAVNANGDSCDTYFNVLADPQFSDSVAGIWTLGSGSVAAGAGNWNTIPLDIDSTLRPLPAGTLPDIGAYESSEGNLPEGIFGSVSGSLGPGTIKVVADVLVDPASSLTLAAGTTLLFCGPSRMDIQGPLTAIGTVTDSISMFTDTVTNPGRWRGITMSNNAGVSDFEYVSITDARALTTSRTQGGGIRMTGISPTFSHSTISRHKALQGGAVFLDGSSPSFTDCSLMQSSADSGGVVFARTNSNPIFDGCRIMNGQATGGAGYLAQNASGQLINCRLENNGSVAAGGAVMLITAPAVIRNNLILNNSASQGAGIWSASTSINCQFNTIAGNTAVEGAGVYLRFGSSVINNNIISGNHGQGIYFFVTPTSTVKFNCIAYNDSANFAFFNNSSNQGPVGIGAQDSLNYNGDPCDRYYNIQLNPEWVSGTGHDYYLGHLVTGQAMDSPCLNAGDSTSIAPVGTTRTDFISDNARPDQGFHGPLLGGPPLPVDDLVIRAAADSVRLDWSYDGTGLFSVKSDSLDTGGFLSTVAVTADTFVVLPYAPPMHSTRNYFKVIVEPLP